MTRVQESIPEHLRPQVDAALDWFNGHYDATFEVTGIVDPEAAASAAGPRELRLVLCGEDRCEQRSFRVTPCSAGFDVALLPETDEGAGAARPAELDPPPGARRGWLDAALARHRFAVLLFYRGYW